LGVCLLAGVAGPAAGQATATYEPQVGQEGKDVVWVPTPQATVDRMLDLTRVTPQDYVIDLGSGDGRTVITAAKRGATAMGIEFNPDMVALSKRNATAEGVTARATFREGDLFEADLTKATVITMFLLPDINLRLRPTLLDLKPGTRIASNTFTMDEWEADETSTVEEGCTSWCTALMWVVPAKAEGTWTMPNGQLTLVQKFQFLTGSLSAGGKSSPVIDARLRGETISFMVDGARYTGKVTGDSMAGTVETGGRTSDWSAKRGR
jgi:precorrin-6B methylase 2